MNDQNPSTLELGLATRRDAETVRLRLNVGDTELVIDAKLSTVASLAGSIASALAQSGDMVKPPAATRPGLERMVDRKSTLSERIEEFKHRLRGGAHPATIAGLLDLHLHFDALDGCYFVTDLKDISPTA